MCLDDDLQSKLVDILGFDDLDLVQELIVHRDSIVKPEVQEEFPEISGPMNYDGLRILNRREREERLRLLDIAHKSKALGPKLSGPDKDYPHIYRAHDAGNTLNAFGQKYKLPVGSKRDEHEV